MVAVINVDAYSLLAFSNLEDTGISVFCYTIPLNSKETELGRSNQAASPSAGKKLG